MGEVDTHILEKMGVHFINHYPRGIPNLWLSWLISLPTELFFPL